MSERGSLAGTRICRVATVPYHLASLNDQFSRLVEEGADLTIVSSGGDDVDRLSHPELHRTVDIPRQISPWRDLLAILRLIRFFREESFDVVHSDTPKAGLLVAIAAKVGGVPVRLHTWTGQRWAVLPNGPLRSMLRGFDRLIGRLNSHCYADSRSQMAFLVGEGIVSANRISVVGGDSNAGVDLARFDPGRWTRKQRQDLRARLGIPSGSIVIVFVGRITEDKGIRELLDAFHLLRESDASCDLLLVGPFDQDQGGAATIDESEIRDEPRVHWVGYTDAPEEYLAIADLFCLPSYREGFGTVVIEAAAMGVPAIGTRIVGLVDAIVDEQTGLLIEPRSSEDLARALARCATDSELRQRMAAAARKRCHSQFDQKTKSEAVVLEYRKRLTLSD